MKLLFVAAVLALASYQFGRGNALEARYRRHRNRNRRAGQRARCACAACTGSRVELDSYGESGIVAEVGDTSRQDAHVAMELRTARIRPGERRPYACVPQCDAGPRVEVGLESAARARPDRALAVVEEHERRALDHRVATRASASTRSLCRWTSTSSRRRFCAAAAQLRSRAARSRSPSAGSGTPRCRAAPRMVARWTSSKRI